MNAIAMLKADHKKVRRLFTQFAAAKRSVERKRHLAEKACKELEIHAKLEENDFYPALASTSEEGADFMRVAEQEHKAVDDLIAQLRRTPADSAQYDTVFASLRDNVEHHVAEEEGRMFPYAERVLGSGNLDHLAHRMTERKRSLSGPGLLERAKKLVSGAVEAVSETVAEITGNGTTTGHAPTKNIRQQKTAPTRATNALSARAKRPRATPSKSTKAKPAARKVGAKAAGKPIAKGKARSANAPRKSGRRAAS